VIEEKLEEIVRFRADNVAVIGAALSTHGLP
jgi:hypothetical protein